MASCFLPTQLGVDPMAGALSGLLGGQQSNLFATQASLAARQQQASLTGFHPFYGRLPESKPKTFHEELQQEVNDWLKDVKC